jgi:hypothetical protein
VHRRSWWFRNGSLYNFDRVVGGSHDHMIREIENSGSVKGMHSETLGLNSGIPAPTHPLPSGARVSISGSF